MYIEGCSILDKLSSGGKSTEILCLLLKSVVVRSKNKVAFNGNPQVNDQYLKSVFVLYLSKFLILKLSKIILHVCNLELGIGYLPLSVSVVLGLYSQRII